jgi:hypothetical protein
MHQTVSDQQLRDMITQHVAKDPETPFGVAPSLSYIVFETFHLPAGAAGPNWAMAPGCSAAMTESERAAVDCAVKVLQHTVRLHVPPLGSSARGANSDL